MTLLTGSANPLLRKLSLGLGALVLDLLRLTGMDVEEMRRKLAA